jgi:hypothetical protein
MKRSLLDAFQQMQPTRLFCLGYAWHHQVFGELTGSTVVDSIDGQVAVRSFQSKHPHLTRVWLETPETATK